MVGLCQAMVWLAGRALSSNGWAVVGLGQAMVWLAVGLCQAMVWLSQPMVGLGPAKWSGLVR